VTRIDPVTRMTR